MYVPWNDFREGVEMFSFRKHQRMRSDNMDNNESKNPSDAEESRSAHRVCTKSPHESRPTVPPLIRWKCGQCQTWSAWQDNAEVPMRRLLFLHENNIIIRFESCSEGTQWLWLPLFPLRPARFRYNSTALSNLLFRAVTSCLIRFPAASSCQIPVTPP